MHLNFSGLTRKLGIAGFGEKSCVALEKVVIMAFDCASQLAKKSKAIELGSLLLSNICGRFFGRTEIELPTGLLQVMGKEKGVHGLRCGPVDPTA